MGNPADDGGSQVPFQEADLSVRQVGLFASLGELSDMDLLSRDAVMNHMRAHDMNFNASHGMFVDHTGPSDDGAHYEVHVAVSNKHEVVQVLVPRFELEMYEKILEQGPFDLDGFLDDFF
jgi:hypothetical protein